MHISLNEDIYIYIVKLLEFRTTNVNKEYLNIIFLYLKNQKM